ncbi:MAG: peptide deformylase [Balneolaceae bacterium]|nr:MAG: peptide deformylase [Balneolaceae bacterium]
MPILPIVTYNDPVLKRKADPVSFDNKELQKLIQDMFDTMYNSGGVGLAAPQIGKSIRLFVMDADAMTEELDEEQDLGPMVFINPVILSKEGEKSRVEEGCLSIPELRDDVSRPDRVTIRYFDQTFQEQTRVFDGWVSRVIQHEYDHLEGVLFIDYLSAFRRTFHKAALKRIETGQIETSYPVVPKN